MKKLSGILKSPKLPPVLLTLGVVSAVLFYAMRFSWVFINITLKFSGFTLALLLVMIANVLTMGVLWALRLYNVRQKGEPICEKKTYSVAFLISGALSLIFFIISVVYIAVTASKESGGEFLLYLSKSLFKAAFFIAVPLFAVFVPKMGANMKKAIVSVALVGTFIFGFAQLFPLTVYKITSEPVVIDNGNEYSVVFSTSDAGTGYVTYTFGGKEYKVFDASGGRICADSRIHSISVPYEHLRNNSYKVGSTRVIEEYSYGSRLGKEVTSQEYAFKFADGENQTYLVISDWHTELNKAYDAIKHAGEYDSVILLGDSSPGVDFEEDVVRNVVEFAGRVTGGTKPVIYTRGNHETRGAYASKIQNALGLDEFYYVAEMGPYSFVVLDSGEDKDDSHPEYGGLDNYNDYRAQMVEWMKTAETKSNKVIALSHSWQISDVEENLSDDGWKELDRLGTRILLSGHTHVCRLIGDGSDREKEISSRYPDIIGYMDGGKSGGTYTASKMTLTSETIKLEAFNNSGEKVFDEEFKW